MKNVPSLITNKTSAYRQRHHQVAKTEYQEGKEKWTNSKEKTAIFRARFVCTGVYWLLDSSTSS